MERVLVVVVVVRSGSGRWGVVVLPCWSQPAAVSQCLAATMSRIRTAVSSREYCSGLCWANTARCYLWSAFRLPANKFDLIYWLFEIIIFAVRRFLFSFNWNYYEKQIFYLFFIICDRIGDRILYIYDSIHKYNILWFRIIL